MFIPCYIKVILVRKKKKVFCNENNSNIRFSVMGFLFLEFAGDSALTYSNAFELLLKRNLSSP